MTGDSAGEAGIRILDMAEQGESSETIDLTEQIIESQQGMENEKLEKLQPSWDARQDLVQWMMPNSNKQWREPATSNSGG